MSEDYEARMARAAQCVQTIEAFRANDDPSDAPIRLNFASKGRRDWLEAVQCYQEALDTYREFNKPDQAKELVESLFDLVQTCDESASGFAIHLLLALKDSIAWLEKILPGTRDRLKLGLRQAIGKKMLEHELDFWLIATRADRQASDHRSAFELLRDLADDEQERHTVDIDLCHAMELAAQTCLRRGNLDGAEGWYHDAAQTAQDRVGDVNWASQLLEIASAIQRMRAQRPPSPAFVQAMQAEAPSSPEYVEAMEQMGTAESLNVIFLKGIEEQHRERFLPSVEQFRSEYASEADKLAKLLADERLLLDHAAIGSRASLYRGRGLAGYLDSGRFVDAQGNPRGNFCFEDRFTVQYVAEVAEVVGTLLRTWRETGDLQEQQIIALVKHNAPDYDWYIFEAGLSRYFQEDHVCAVHTLIPQFENVVRMWVQMTEGSVKRLKRGMPGDALLNDLINPSKTETRASLGARLFDLIYWYMVNSGGPFGYRHKVAHGRASPEECSSDHLPAMTIWLTLKIIERWPGGT